MDRQYHEDACGGTAQVLVVLGAPIMSTMRHSRSPSFLASFKMFTVASIALLSFASLRCADSFLSTTSAKPTFPRHVRHFGNLEAKMAADSVAEAKAQVLQLAAAMDRGGMANPGEKLRRAFGGTD